MNLKHPPKPALKFILKSLFLEKSFFSFFPISNARIDPVP